MWGSPTMCRDHPTLCPHTSAPQSVGLRATNPIAPHKAFLDVATIVTDDGTSTQNIVQSSRETDASRHHGIPPLEPLKHHGSIVPVRCKGGTPNRPRLNGKNLFFEKEKISQTIPAKVDRFDMTEQLLSDVVLRHFHFFVFLLPIDDIFVLRLKKFNYIMNYIMFIR